MNKPTCPYTYRITNVVHDKGYCEFISNANEVAGEIYFEFGTTFCDLKRHKNGCIVLLTVNGIPVSVCYIKIHYRSDVDLTIYVSDVGTSPENEHKGYGKYMLNRVKEFAVKNGFNEIVLERDENVKEFYEKCGFIIDPENCTYFWNQSISNIDPVIENYSIQFEHNRYDNKFGDKLKGLRSLEDLNYFPCYPNYQYICSDYEDCYSSFYNGIFVIINLGDKPVAACFLKSNEENKNELELLIMSALVSEERYDKFLMEEVKNYMRENNVSIINVRRSTPNGKAFFAECGMSIQENNHIIALSLDT